jgi:hypothetical protein
LFVEHNHEAGTTVGQETEIHSGPDPCSSSTIFCMSAAIGVLLDFRLPSKGVNVNTIHHFAKPLEEDCAKIFRFRCTMIRASMQIVLFC